MHIQNPILATRFLAAAKASFERQVTGPPSQRQGGDEGRRQGVVLSVCSARGFVGYEKRSWGAVRRRLLRFLLVYAQCLGMCILAAAAKPFRLWATQEALEHHLNASIPTEAAVAARSRS